MAIILLAGHHIPHAETATVGDVLSAQTADYYRHLRRYASSHGFPVDRLLAAVGRVKGRLHSVSGLAIPGGDARAGDRTAKGNHSYLL